MPSRRPTRPPPPPPPGARAFPPGFLWGVGTSAYQNEGGNDLADWFLFEQGLLEKAAGEGPIKTGERCGRAVDFYHRYAEDAAAARALGANALRLSVEWARVEPSPGRFDLGALDHYKDVLRALRAQGLEPLVTLHHFTNPVWVAAMGGWERPLVVERFGAYVARVAAHLADEARWWITLNEPMVLAAAGYVSGDFAPGRRNDMKAALQVATHLLKAHARAYHAIHAAYPGRTRPLVGVANHVVRFEPFHRDPPLRQVDQLLAEAAERLVNRAFPEAMRSGRIRLDAFALRVDEAVPGLRGTMDFVGVNYYQRHLSNALDPLAANGVHAHPGAVRNDLGWQVWPEGLYHALVDAGRYGKPVLVTECGTADASRATVPGFLHAHLAAAWRALQAGVDLQGYVHWALTDNFEWQHGYAARFGLLAVEPDDPALTRRWTPGADAFRAIATANALPPG